MDVSGVGAPFLTASQETQVPDGSVQRADRIVEDVEGRSGQDLIGLACRSGFDDDAAQDLVQDALLKLWTEVRSGVDILDPTAWTFRVLYRRAMDEHRVRRRVRDLVARMGLGLATTGEAVATDDRVSIWSAVDRLPTRQRQVLYLRYKADMTFDQLATVIGITASAARAHASFALGRLREALGTQWQD
jgi:RNA polymerase sigma factor (sigma-70 family)